MSDIDKIKVLANASSQFNGTDLITVYIPHTENISSVNSHINKEIKTATNIKNKTISKNVTCALKAIGSNLATLNQIPDNGLVICAGSWESQVQLGFVGCMV